MPAALLLHQHEDLVGLHPDSPVDPDGRRTADATVVVGDVHTDDLVAADPQGGLSTRELLLGNRGTRPVAEASVRARVVARLEVVQICLRRVADRGGPQWTFGELLSSTRSMALCRRNATVASGQCLIQCSRPTPKERH